LVIDVAVILELTLVFGFFSLYPLLEVQPEKAGFLSVAGGRYPDGSADEPILRVADVGAADSVLDVVPAVVG
ncbi:MAG: hypothetical protein ACP5FL_07730, partial [Thermoplasmatota archaeon]